MARRRRRHEPESARIESSTHDGRGIVTVDGKKVFVAGALPGEEVRFQRRKMRRNFDEAELLEILAVSPDRIEARCEAYGRCGGCSMQHISAEQQREIKAQTLRDNLERIGRVTPETWLEPMTRPGPGTIGAARVWPSRMCTPRAGFWSDFESDTRRLSPTCIAARYWRCQLTA